MMTRLANTTSTRQVLHICGPSGWTWAGYRSIIIIILLYNILLVAYIYNFDRVCHISLLVVVVVLYVRMLSSVCCKCIYILENGENSFCLDHQLIDRGANCQSATITTPGRRARPVSALFSSSIKIIGKCIG